MASRDDELYRLEFPVFALVGEQSGCLYYAEMDEFKERGGTATVLFHTEDSAQAWLAAIQAGPLTEHFRIQRYDEKDGRDLLETLRAVSVITQTMVVFLTKERQQFVDLAGFVLAFDRAKERVGRAITSGTFGQIYQEHEIDGFKIVSMLTSEGSYSAMRRPNGVTLSTESREAAVAAVLRHEKSSRSEQPRAELE